MTDISIKDEQSANIQCIAVTLEVFQLEIFFNDFNYLHPSNIKLMSVTLIVFHLQISGRSNNDLHLKNI